MKKPIVNPVAKVNSSSGSRENQFSELMTEISYGIKRMRSEKWNRADYFNHMADFHDYINDPAPNLRILADKWLQEHSG